VREGEEAGASARGKGRTRKDEESRREGGGGRETGGRENGGARAAARARPWTYITRKRPTEERAEGRLAKQKKTARRWSARIKNEG